MFRISGFGFRIEAFVMMVRDFFGTGNVTSKESDYKR